MNLIHVLNSLSPVLYLIFTIVYEPHSIHEETKEIKKLAQSYTSESGRGKIQTHNFLTKEPRIFIPSPSTPQGSLALQKLQAFEVDRQTLLWLFLNVHLYALSYDCLMGKACVFISSPVPAHLNQQLAA